MLYPSSAITYFHVSMYTVQYAQRHQLHVHNRAKGPTSLVLKKNTKILFLIVHMHNANLLALLTYCPLLKL